MFFLSNKTCSVWITDHILKKYSHKGLFMVSSQFNCLVIKRNYYLLLLPIQINSKSIGMFIIGMRNRPLYTGKPILRGTFKKTADRFRQGPLYRGSLYSEKLRESKKLDVMGR